jgi:hypothetical protein
VIPVVIATSNRFVMQWPLGVTDKLLEMDLVAMLEQWEVAQCRHLQRNDQRNGQ